MSHILVAVATPLAATNMSGPLSDLARRYKAKVTVLHLLTAGGGHAANTLANSRETVERLGEHLRTEGVECDMLDIEPGEDIAGTILATAETVGASLIFMGITGKSAFARRSVGDIPTQLLSRTSLPVLLLPPAADGTL